MMGHSRSKREDRTMVKVCLGTRLRGSGMRLLRATPVVGNQMVDAERDGAEMVLRWWSLLQSVCVPL